MNWLDIVILAFAGVSAIGGWGTGLMRMGVSLVGIVVGIVLARNYFADVAPIFDSFTDSPNAENVLGFLLIFLVVLAGTALLGSLLTKVIGALMLGWANRLGGLALGAFLAFGVASAVLSVVDSFPILDLEKTIADSALGTFLVEDFDVVLRGPNLLPDDLTVELSDL